MRRLLSIPALLALICTVTSHHTDAQGITDILSLIARGDTAKSMSDSIVKHNTGSVLSFIIEAETDDSDTDIEAWDIARALDACGEAWNDSSYTLTGDALGYISKVYATNDFYKSGAWDLQQLEPMEIGVPPKALLEFTGGLLRNAPRFGRLTSGFGFRPRFGRMHKGLDFAMAVGDTVHVPLSGTVSHVGTGKGYGTYVIIMHGGGLETRYAHLQASLVQPGDVVNLGDVLVNHAK